MQSYNRLSSCFSYFFLFGRLLPSCSSSPFHLHSSLFLPSFLHVPFLFFTFIFLPSFLSITSFLFLFPFFIFLHLSSFLPLCSSSPFHLASFRPPSASPCFHLPCPPSSLSCFHPSFAPTFLSPPLFLLFSCFHLSSAIMSLSCSSPFSIFFSFYFFSRSFSPLLSFFLSHLLRTSFLLLLNSLSLNHFHFPSSFAPRIHTCPLSLLFSCFHPSPIFSVLSYLSLFFPFFILFSFCFRPRALLLFSFHSSFDCALPSPSTLLSCPSLCSPFIFFFLFSLFSRPFVTLLTSRLPPLLPLPYALFLSLPFPPLFLISISFPPLSSASSTLL